MPARKLNELLNELHRQLEQSDSIDDEAREGLRTIVEDIRRVMPDVAAEAGGDAGASGSDEPDERGFPERLTELVEQFEDEHPVLAKRLSLLITALGRIGF